MTKRNKAKQAKKSYHLRSITGGLFNFIYITNLNPTWAFTITVFQRTCLNTDQNKDLCWEEPPPPQQRQQQRPSVLLWVTWTRTCVLFTSWCRAGCSHVPLPVSFVLLRSFTGCHGLCLQGEELCHFPHHTGSLAAAVLITITIASREESQPLSLLRRHNDRVPVGYTMRSVPTWNRLGMQHPLSPSVWVPAALVSCGWCAEEFAACLCLTLLWKAPIPSGDPCTTGLCVVVITMSPASAATASESATATTTVPEEETESPREEVRIVCSKLRLLSSVACLSDRLPLCMLTVIISR